MKIITDLNECNTILKAHDGASAQIWRYEVTHRRIVLRLWRFDTVIRVNDEPFIVALGCEFISGSFSWKNIEILISEETNEANEQLFKLMDQKVGFVLIASSGISVMFGVDEKSEYAEKMAEKIGGSHLMNYKGDWMAEFKRIAADANSELHFDLTDLTQSGKINFEELSEVLSKPVSNNQKEISTLYSEFY